MCAVVRTSGLACDWWGAGFDRDMDFAAQMNHNGHRLSIEWSRIEPKEGQWDSAAIDRYRYMLKAMRERGIEPMVTLHHFTNPLWVVERGGWETPDIVPLFERLRDEGRRRAEGPVRSVGDDQRAERVRRDGLVARTPITWWSSPRRRSTFRRARMIRSWCSRSSIT